MKKIIFALMIAFSGVGIYSCKESQIEDLTLPDTPSKTVSGDGIVSGSVTVSNEFVKVPFKISLNGVADEAFQIGITLFNDTVTQLINNNTIANGLLMPAGAVEYPNVINVAYGDNQSQGVATIRRYVLERNYNKKLAFALKLSAPGKNNKIAAGKSTIVVVINPADYIKPEELHYLDINGGGIFNVTQANKNYTTSLAGITIPIIVSVKNQPSTAFNVDIKQNKDTIATLIANGTLPNTIHLAANQYTLDTIARVGTGASSAVVRLQIPWPVFDANIQANKKFAFALSLANPTNHVLDPAKSKVIIWVDPTVNLDNNSYITGNGTGLKAQYFTSTQALDTQGATPFVTRTDGTIEFNGDGWPDNVKNAANQSLSRDNFSTRWKGEFLAPVRGEYIFYQTRWDDGSRLYINGKAIIDDFTTQWDKPERNAKIVLERGVRYTIEAHHRENVGGQQAYLEFEVPSAGISKRVVPKSQLFPAQ